MTMERTKTMTDAEVMEVFAAVDRKDARGFAAHFAEGAPFRFANAEAVVGPAAVEAACAAFFGGLESLRHEVTGIWRGQDGEYDVVCVEATVHYRLPDGRTLSLPSDSTMRLGGGMIRDYRITIDLAPMFAV